jgi:diguanylate cyclase (GGDEF)-like protein
VVGKMKILLAEDITVTRKLVKRILENNGYKVIEARDGQEAWEILQKEKEKINLALIDWLMPRLNGLQLCKRIKATENQDYTYIIFLTGNVDIDDVVEGLASGADDYVTKPFDKRELISRIDVGKRFIQLHQKLREASHQLHILSITDGLTQILNRRALLERLEEELYRANRENAFFSLVMLDIDHFKKVNDKYGHQAGDKVLVEVVNRVKSKLRSYDIIGRYGGEEFVVGIFGADKEMGINKAEDFRRCIDEKEFEYNDKKLKISISLGVSYQKIEDSKSDISQLLDDLSKKADSALYRAKETGRNKVVCADELDK